VDNDPLRHTRVNLEVAGLLRDYAEVHKAEQSRWGYRRAAATVRDLDRSIREYLQPDGTLRKIPTIGPASSRIVLEVLATGTSASVEDAIQKSSHKAEIERRRKLRAHFLSRADALAVLDASLPAAVSASDYQGDLQMHSTWSDGSQTLEEIVASRLAHGYRFSAVTDHSYGLPIAGGVSMERLAEQHHEIDRLNAAHAGRFRLLKGIEANIRADGTVDMTPDELATLEIVVAAPHSVLRSAADQTARLVQAIETPGVHILGHPRGRMYGSRPGLNARWEDVFAAAARAGVAVEIDGDPARQDLDFSLARLAMTAGCLIAIDTDAHSVGDMAYVDLALAHARLAGVPPDRVINTWPLETLLDWAADRRAA